MLKKFRYFEKLRQCFWCNLSLPYLEAGKHRDFWMLGYFPFFLYSSTFIIPVVENLFVLSLSKIFLSHPINPFSHLRNRNRLYNPNHRVTRIEKKSHSRVICTTLSFPCCFRMFLALLYPWVLS